MIITNELYDLIVNCTVDSYCGDGFYVSKETASKILDKYLSGFEVIRIAPIYISLEDLKCLD